MFLLLRLSALVLAVAAVQPLIAAEPAETAASGAGPVAMSEAAAAAPVNPSTRVPLHLSASSLMRVVALSAARMIPARQPHELIHASLVRPFAQESVLERFPVIAAMRRHSGERWNTTDSSRPSDFALCYRLSRVMGLQVIPGDLTPSKLPTPRMVSVKNQGSGMGVLVGMTFRLGRAGR